MGAHSHDSDSLHPRPEVGRDDVARLLDQEALAIAFQPIVDLKAGEVVGFEALTRPNQPGSFRNPSELFEAAEKFDLLQDVESLTRRKAIQAAATWNAQALLFMNNSPVVISRRDFVESVNNDIANVPDVQPGRVVLEVTERDGHLISDHLTTRSLELREAGFQVGIDDVGAGISGLNQIMSLRPNWIKLDRELVAHIDFDPLKQNLIRFFVHFAKVSRIGLVAEGMERQEELATLIHLGVSHGQGYLLGRPGLATPSLSDDLRQTIVSLHDAAEATRFSSPSVVRVASLVTPAATFDVSCTVEEVRERLATMAHHTGVVAMDGRRCMGWVDRARVMTWEPTVPQAKLSSLFGAPSPIVAAEVTLAEAMELVAARPEEGITSPLVVQKGGTVLGVVPMRQLLLAAADAARQQTVHTAPLTGLPNRVQADRWLSNHIKARDPVDIVYIDLRDFDAYNTAYGFEMGDSMLLRLVGLTHARVIDRTENRPFFAHLGEDRFLVALPSNSIELLKDLLAKFENMLPEFFSPVDFAASAFRSTDAGGRERTLPLTTIRVVYLPSALRRVNDVRELHEWAAALRARSPSSLDAPNEIIVDRRDDCASGAKRQIA